jgi:hypothetical protein
MKEIKVLHIGTKHIVLVDLKENKEIFKSSKKTSEDNFLEACEFVFKNFDSGTYKLVGAV